MMDTKVWIRILLGWWLGWAGSTALAQPADAQPVWPTVPDTQRLQSAFFRYELTLGQSPDTAVIHLFADSRYHLQVNGTFIGYGPARSYPAHPEYDSHDVRAYLRPGRNVIAVQVLSNGTSTYQLRNNPAAFWAWGSVVAGEARHDLATPGNWQTRLSQGYDPHAAKVSFAMGPMEIYDARRDPQDWATLDADPSGWIRPQPLRAPWPWGSMAARSIPPLTNTRWQPFTLCGAYPLLDDEQVWACRVPSPDYTREEYSRAEPQLGYTYVYSPRKQQVPVSLWWGRHYLHGQGLIEQKPAPVDQPARQLATLSLKRGWNAFTVQQNSIWGGWDFYLGAPRSAGLELSPRQQRGDSLMFMTAVNPGPAAEAVAMPFDPASPPAGFTWQAQPLRSIGPDPARDLAWATLGERLPLGADEIDSLTLTDESALVFDFRYKRLARVIIDYEAPAGTVFDLAFTEDTLAGRPRVLKRHGVCPAYRHIAAGGKGRLETFRPYGMRFLMLSVREHGGQPVKIHRVAAMEHVYPQTSQGRFTCSNPMLNHIWDMGWRTLQVCMEDSYTDTPFRERGLYAGDMLPQMAITLVTSGDVRLVRRSLRLFQDMYADRFNPGQPRDPDEISVLEDFPLLTLEALVWYLDYTQDQAFAEALFPAYCRLIDAQLAERNSEGLILNQQVFIDWIQLDKREVNNAAYHALLARSCQLAARLAQRLGQPELVAHYQAAVSSLTETLQQQYWDEQAGAFVDGIKEGQRIPHYFPISSAWPYLFDLTSSAQNEAIIPFLVQKMGNIGDEDRHRETNPYGSFYLLSALYQAGQTAAAEAFIQKHWAPMILDGDDTAWENFGAEMGQGTRSHAWSGHPTYFLSTRVLGVNLMWPQGGSLDTVRIAPQAETIDWAEGTVPHPKGPIEVAWRIDGEWLRLDYQAPAGVAVEVAPQGRLAKLRLVVNGQE
jgi:hypothetical protein